MPSCFVACGRFAPKELRDVVFTQLVGLAWPAAGAHACCHIVSRQWCSKKALVVEKGAPHAAVSCALGVLVACSATDTERHDSRQRTPPPTTATPGICMQLSSVQPVCHSSGQASTVRQGPCCFKGSQQYKPYHN